PLYASIAPDVCPSRSAVSPSAISSRYSRSRSTDRYARMPATSVSVSTSRAAAARFISLEPEAYSLMPPAQSPTPEAFVALSIPRNNPTRPGSNGNIVEGVTRAVAPFGDFSSVKQARVVGWSDVAGREASLVQRCASGDEAACADLVAEHQRMVVQLAVNLLSDREEALDLSQEVFLRVFRTIHRLRGQSSLRTWIYRIAVNQARNRHRFWRRRHRNDQVSLDAHVAAHGEFLSGGE